MLIWQKFGCDNVVKQSCYFDKKSNDGSDSVVKIQDGGAYRLCQKRLSVSSVPKLAFFKKEG